MGIDGEGVVKIDGVTAVNSDGALMMFNDNNTSCCCVPPRCAIDYADTFTDSFDGPELDEAWLLVPRPPTFGGWQAWDGKLVHFQNGPTGQDPPHAPFAGVLRNFQPERSGFVFSSTAYYEDESNDIITPKFFDFYGDPTPYTAAGEMQFSALRPSTNTGGSYQLGVQVRIQPDIRFPPRPARFIVTTHNGVSESQQIFFNVLGQARY